MFTKITVAITSQYIYKPSYSIVRLKLITVLYVNDISIKLEKKTRDIGKGKYSFCLHNI